MRKGGYSAALLSTVGALALCAPAQAQDAGGTVAQSEDVIIVTATRRAERLQDVPIAVTAIGAKQIEDTGIRALTDIQYVTPGVQFGSTPNDAGFRIRGAGTLGGFTSASEQPVGLVVDDVVVPFGMPVQNLGPVERIEVLQGPQGTQFGKNSSSGVISITTRAPDPSHAFGSAYASYGELNEAELRASVNVPLSDSAAFNLAAFGRSYDGYVYNATRHEDWGGEETYGLRGRLALDLTPNLSAGITADWSKRSLDGPSQLWTLNKVAPSDIAFNPFIGGTDLAALGITPGYGNETSAEEYPGNVDEQNFGASLEINYKMGGYTLTSISAYRGLKDDPATFAIDGSSLPRFTAQSFGAKSDYLSQELRLTSPSGQPLEYVTGVYVADNDGATDGQSAQLRPAVPFPGPTISISHGIGSVETVSDTAAIYADGRYHLTDQWALLFGARYTHDKVEASRSNRVDPDLVGALDNDGLPPPDSRDTSDNGWSGRFGTELHVTPDVMLYATAARGYLGPTVTYSIRSATPTEVRPQTVDDITIGAKTQFFDHRLTVNGNIFRDEYNDMQVGVFDNTLAEFITENAGGAKTQGAQVDTSWRATDELMFTAGYAYTDATFTDYVTACPTNFVADGTALVNCTAPGGPPGTLYQAEGNVLPNAPKNTFNVGMNFEQPVGGSLLADVSVNYYYRSDTTFEVGNPDTNIPSYDIVNVNLGIGAAGGAWRLGVFARNLFDTHFATGVISLPFGDPGSYVNWNTREARRTVGVSLETNF